MPGAEVTDEVGETDKQEIIIQRVSGLRGHRQDAMGVPPGGGKEGMMEARKVS